MTGSAAVNCYAAHSHYVACAKCWCQLLSAQAGMRSGPEGCLTQLGSKMGLITALHIRNLYRSLHKCTANPILKNTVTECLLTLSSEWHIHHAQYKDNTPTLQTDIPSVNTPWRSPDAPIPKQFDLIPQAVDSPRHCTCTRWMPPSVATLH